MAVELKAIAPTEQQHELSLARAGSKESTHKVENAEPYIVSEFSLQNRRQTVQKYWKVSWVHMHLRLKLMVSRR